MDRDQPRPRRIIIRRSSEPATPNDDVIPGIRPEGVPVQRPTIRVARHSSPIIRPTPPQQETPPPVEPLVTEPVVTSNQEDSVADPEPVVAREEIPESVTDLRTPVVEVVAPRVKRHIFSESERRLFSEPPRELVVMSPQMLAVSAIIRKLGFVPDNIESLIPRFVRAQNALVDQVRNGGSEDQAIRLEDEFLEGMREARASEPNPSKTYKLTEGASGVITLKNVRNGLTILENPPAIRAVVEKSPNPRLGGDAVLQIMHERDDIARLRGHESRRADRLQAESYFPEIRLTQDRNFKPAFEMPFIPPEMNVTVMAQQARLSKRQLREVMAKHAEVIDIVVGAGGWLEDKIESIYLLPNDRYLVLDHDQTFQFRGQRPGTASFMWSEFDEIYPPSERTKQSVAEALKRFTEVAGIIRDQSLRDKLTLMYHRVKDDSEPPMTPGVFARVIEKIDDLGIDDLKEKTLASIATE